MDFVETVTLVLPRVDRDSFAESDFSNTKKGLIVELAAIHAGLTSNHNFYPSEALEGALDSWVNPYPKPILMNHDLTSEPIGRVMAAKMDKEDDGTPYTRLQVAITDPSAIEKFLDQRYLTGSVGGKAEEALCNICGSDWASASITTLPCGHKRGRVYKGQQAHLRMTKVGFKEYSVVNAPADTRSGVRDMANESEELENDEWVRPARLFAINMAEEEMYELMESENRDVLSGLKKKEASPLYLSIKGAFLSALAVSEAEKENSVSEETTVQPNEEEDVLAVAEGLSKDLEQVEEEVSAEEAGAGHAHNHFHEDGTHDHVHSHDPGGYDHGFQDHESNPSPHSHTHADEHPKRFMPPQYANDGDTPIPGVKAKASDDEEQPVEETTVEPTEGEDAVSSWDWSDRQSAEGGERPIVTDPPEAQEREHKHDISPNTSERPGAPAHNWSREGEETLTTETGTDELNEMFKALELRHTELEAEKGQLLEENARLKNALKRSLAERVVDTKITLGLLEKTDREAQLAEHMDRSASSLADSLRDLSSMNLIRKVDYTDFPKVEQESLTLEDLTEKNVVLSLPAEEKEEETIDPEKVFVDVLMGRRSL